MSNGLPTEPTAPALPDLAESIVAVLVDPKNLAKLSTLAQGISLESTKDGAEFGAKIAGDVTGWLAQKIIEATSLPGPVGDSLARAAMDTLLVEGGPRAQAGQQIGRRLIERLAGTGAAMQPGYEGAAGYLGLVLSESIEAWLRGVLVELMSGWSAAGFSIGDGVDAFARLQDIVETMLGGQRMVRQVLAPIIRATAIDPATWQTNKTYRPELLSAAGAVEAFLSSQYSAAQLFEELARQGYSDERINIIVTNARRRLSFGDLEEQHYRGVLSDEQLTQRAGELGYDAITAGELLALHNSRRHDKWNDPIADTAIAAFENHEISEGECERLVAAVAPSHAEGVARVSAAKAKRDIRRRLLSSTDERRLSFKEIRTVADYRRALERESYAPDAIIALELELRFDLDARHDLAAARAAADEDRAREEVEREAAAAARQAAAAARQALPTLTEYKRAYVRGFIARHTFAAAIVREKVAITPADLEIILSDADAAIAAALEREARAEAARLAREIPGLSLAQLEAAVIAGVLSLADYDAAVAKAKFPDDERQILTALLADRLEDRAAAEAARAEAAARAEVKRISLPDFERAVRLGLRTRDEYAALLDALETPEIARALLLDLLDAQMAEEAQTRATRAAREPAAKAAGLSLAQRRRAVVAGVLSRPEYEASLFAARWPAEDVALELALVDLELAEAAAARVRRAEIAAEEEARAAQAAAERLARVERDAAAAIARAEREAIAAAARADREAQEAAERAAREARTQAAAEARAAREALPPTLSLAQMERAVVLGLLPPGALAEYLTVRGYTATDVDTIVNLALARIPDTREAERLEQTVTRELAEKGISFADLKLAARRGLITPGDYADELAARGYGADAIALLRQLLEEQIAIDAAGLRAKTAKTVEAVAGAPSLAAIEAAFVSGELDVSGVRDVLLSFGVPADTALVFARLLLTMGAEA